MDNIFMYSSMTRKIRVYFNKKSEEEGLIWSVDYGDRSTEVFVKDFKLFGSFNAATDLTKKYPDPAAWIWAWVTRIEFKDHVAYITAEAGHESSHTDRWKKFLLSDALHPPKAFIKRAIYECAIWWLKRIGVVGQENP